LDADYIQIAPIVSEVMRKYKSRLKKEDLKRLAKYVSAYRVFDHESILTRPDC